MDLITILKQGFKTCGLYPFDSKAINYNKILKKSNFLENTEASLSNKKEPNAGMNYSVVLNVINQFIDISTLHDFKNARESNECNGEEKNKNPFHLWNKISCLANSTSNEQQNFSLEQHCNINVSYIECNDQSLNVSKLDTMTVSRCCN